MKRKVELLSDELSCLKSEVSSLGKLPTDVPLISISSGNANPISKDTTDELQVVSGSLARQSLGGDKRTNH